MLAVDPDRRGIGIGRDLVRFAERSCADAGLRTMQLELLVPRMDPSIQGLPGRLVHAHRLPGLDLVHLDHHVRDDGRPEHVRHLLPALGLHRTGRGDCVSKVARGSGEPLAGKGRITGGDPPARVANASRSVSPNAVTLRASQK